MALLAISSENTILLELKIYQNSLNHICHLGRGDIVVELSKQKGQNSFQIVFAK